MCGVAGVWAEATDSAVWEQAVRLGAALGHRGPDDAGWLAAWPDSGTTRAGRELGTLKAATARTPGLVLAHRRLSIVDLATGWQPMSNEDGSVWIVYNGEIYNHLALRAELERLGHRFVSRADTEMVVHAYETWGPPGFARFNGIFAFALWDARQRRLVLARDPLGVKPLYFGATPHGVWFASEVKAAIHAGVCTPRLNRAALEPFLTFRFVPSPDTLFAGVSRMPPGHWVIARGDEPRWGAVERYAPLPPSEDGGLPLTEWVERLSDATRKAVAGQLMADVPVGALLSGGLDSSILAAVMREYQPGPVATYAIGYRDAPSGSELEVARRAATALGTNHHEVAADGAGFFEAWADTICQLDEPVATPAHVPVAQLCRRVRQDLKVVLTGQGADEPLGGYLRHSVERWVGWLGWPPTAAALRVAARGYPRSEQLQRLAAVASERDLERRIVAAFTVFAPEWRAALLTSASRSETPPDAVLAPVRRWLQGTEGLDTLNRLLYVDARLSLADDLLLGADKVSMASSVEARVPYLDLDYLAVAERIPGRLKIALRFGRKRLQGLVGRQLLPAPLARDLGGAGRGWRRKRGFDVPNARWFAPGNLPKVAAVLAGNGAALPDYFDREAIVRLLREHERRHADHGRRLTALLTLEAWHRSFIGGDPTPVRRLFDGHTAHE